MKLTHTAVLTSYSLGAVMAMRTPTIGHRAAGDGEVVELCPNPDFQTIGSSVPCLNYTNPAAPKGYGQRDTCSKYDMMIHITPSHTVRAETMDGSLIRGQ